jgi:cell pole-organizing protein PopZ
MSLLENRLSLRRQQCEEQRRYVADLDSMAQRLRADERRLQADIERAVAGSNPVFAGPLLKRHSTLARSIAAIDAQIAAAGDALAAAAQELERHELTAAQRAGNAGVSDRRRAPRSPSARQAASEPERHDDGGPTQPPSDGPGFVRS